MAKKPDKADTSKSDAKKSEAKKAPAKTGKPAAIALSDEAFNDAALMALIGSQAMPLPPVMEVAPSNEFAAPTAPKASIASPNDDVQEQESAGGFGDMAPDRVRPNGLPAQESMAVGAASVGGAPATREETIWRSFSMPGANKDAPWVSGSDDFEDDFVMNQERLRGSRQAARQRFVLIAATLLITLGVAGYWGMIGNKEIVTLKALGELSSTRGKLVVIDLQDPSASGAIKRPSVASEAVVKPKVDDKSVGEQMVQTIVAPAVVAKPAMTPPPDISSSPSAALATMSTGLPLRLGDTDAPLPPRDGYETPQFAKMSDVAQAALPPPVAGGSAWTENGRPFGGSSTMPRVALIVTGMGLDQASSTAVINRLPAEVTLSFSPYAPHLEAQIASARAHGHEVLLDLPMEPIDFPTRDAGPLAIMASGNVDENNNRLAVLLAKAGGCAGFLGADGGKALQNAGLMAPIARELASRGLMWVQPPRSPLLGLATGGPTAMATLIVDQRGFALSTENRLDYLTQVARQQGVALGIARALPATMAAVLHWADGLKAAGVALAPATATATIRPMPLASTPQKAG